MQIQKSGGNRGIHKRLLHCSILINCVDFSVHLIHYPSLWMFGCAHLNAVYNNNSSNNTFDMWRNADIQIGNKHCDIITTAVKDRKRVCMHACMFSYKKTMSTFSPPHPPHATYITSLLGLNFNTTACVLISAAGTVKI